MTGIALARSIRRREAVVQRCAGALAHRVRRAWRRRELRRYLTRMDEMTLADIGVSRAQALFELDRDG
jgi:uncharacterized protein YjiS (DUF1127 family)